MKKIHISGPWVTEHEIETVEKAMRDWYDKPYYYCEEFQRVFAEFHDRKYALMTPNCTTAIHLILTALGVGMGDEVIVPECTWIATAAPITYLGAEPVFCDIEPINWCLDPDSVRRSITTKTKAIIVVDLYGNMPLMDELIEIAAEHNIALLEDAAEALGSTYRGVRAGKFGTASMFSFHRTKTLTTGEGGMLLLDDDKLYERCAFLRDHGRKPGGQMYYNYEVTYKYMPFNVQAALGYAQFQRLDELVGKKHWILEKYREKLSDLDHIQLNAEPDYIYNSAWITTLVFEDIYDISKQNIIESLEKFDVPARPFFYPLSEIPAYNSLTEKYQGKNPCAHDISQRGINLPGALNLEEDQIDYICKSIKSVLKK